MRPAYRPLHSLEAADARFLRRLLVRAVRSVVAAPIASAVALTACAATPHMEDPLDPMGTPPTMITPPSPRPSTPTPTPTTPDPVPVSPTQTPISPTRTPRSFTLDCEGGVPQLAANMALAYDVDYLAQAEGATVFSERGTRCASAT